MSLVRAERRRFLKRRLIKWLLVIAVALLAIIATAVFFSNQKVDAATIAAAEAQADQEYQQQVMYWEQRHQVCGTVKEGTPEAEMCTYDLKPQRSDIRAEWYMPATFGFKANFEPLTMVWAAIIAVIAFVIGASFVGAEWSTGAMMSLLTWQPRRMRVLGTKLAVLAGWLTGIGVVTFGLWTGALWLIARLRGDTDGMTAGTWQSFGLTGLRGLGLILAMGIVGFLLASIGRHTGVALGVALAVVIVGQVGLTIVLTMLQVPYFGMYLLPMHLLAWMQKSFVVGNEFANCANPNGCEEVVKTLTWQGTGSIMLGVTVLLAVLAFWQIRRRDVA
ncbi:ABC transporter permease subunit [Catellatospora sp. KI3]|uniref:ABC transporter permease subunit n=1 Tax=Catellatospora sp. KI3 TaxID=3041620 RepID=UPI00248329E7|nr:ABC transporter permease subunit [Catellatospora sp. KI3]MDI1465823.1 ABC transporter permease subunit [Catellatospora sp. KI3]